MAHTIFNILRDITTGIHFKMNLYEYLNGGFLVGLEKRNPNIELIDSLLTEEQADKRIILLNQTDM